MYDIPRDIIMIIVAYARSQRMLIAGGSPKYLGIEPILTVSLMYPTDKGGGSTSATTTPMIPMIEEWTIGSNKSTVIQKPLRQGGACGVIGEYIYHTAGESSECKTASTSRYHIDTGECTQVAQMNSNREWPIYCVINDQFYCGGIALHYLMMILI
jgi:hypothetical protein